MSSLLQRLFGKKTPPSAQAPAPQPIIVVSGLPRSGTSLMMKMLEAGGLTTLTDNLRLADDDNPKGYYEFERVKQLDKGDATWLAEAPGKVVKIISALLRHLPPTYNYQVIFMQRAMPEVLASQRKMLRHRGEEENNINDAEMAALFGKHLQTTKSWWQQQPNIKVIEVDYNQMVADPLPYIQRIEKFLGRSLNTVQMAQAIDPALYRNRA